jgi:pyruvate formate lyase activating enzyme
MPLIHGYNDTSAELEKAVDMISSLRNVRRVDIIPFHPYGMSKYDEIGKPCPAKEQAEDRYIPEEKQSEILELLKSRGIDAQIGG